ncbi:MAG: response regulator, partial [Planctomycetota bacterium]
MPKTLLLADDSVTIQKVVGISFANEDVTLLTVDNGDDAVARVREARPDIILADVVMPGMNGYEVCEAIKSDPELSHTPVLLLTGTFEAFDEERAAQVGADGHTTKPFDAQSLVDQVTARLAQAAAPALAPEPGPAYEPSGSSEKTAELGDSLELHPEPDASAQGGESFDFF